MIASMEGADIGSVVLELDVGLIDQVMTLADENSLSPADFISIILTHHFHRGLSIGYVMDKQMYSLDVDLFRVGPIRVDDNFRSALDEFVG